MKILTLLILVLALTASAQKYRVTLIQRDSEPILSNLVKNNSKFKQVFNPTWITPSEGTFQRQGLLIRTQDCDYNESKCIFCGGAANKASFMTFSE